MLAHARAALVGWTVNGLALPSREALSVAMSCAGLPAMSCAGLLAVSCAGLLLSGCGKDRPDLGKMLSSAQETVAAAEYDEGFDSAVSVLEELARQHDDLPVAYKARLGLGKAHLDLLLTAMLTRETAYYDKAKKALGWTLQGEISDIRNFQALCQDVMEELRLVAREAAKVDADLSARAEALAKLTEGLQGLYYRNKEGYFRGRDAVSRFDDYRIYDDLLAVRDLTQETLHRADVAARNWQNIVLTVIGRICPKQAARYVAMVCSPTRLEDATEYCRPDLAGTPKASLDGALAMLIKECSASPAAPLGTATQEATNVGATADPAAKEGKAGTSGTAGVAVVRAFYMASAERLAAGRSLLPPALAPVLDAWALEVDQALAALNAMLGVQ